MYAQLLQMLVATSALTAAQHDTVQPVLSPPPLAASAETFAFEPAPASASLDDVLELPAPLRIAFQQQVLEGRPERTALLNRLVDFVLDPSAMGVRYSEYATHTVAQTWATRRANCIGFTLLFFALAREAGLPAQAQEFANTLAWRESGSTVYRSSHVNLGLRIGLHRYTLDVARDAVVTTGQPKLIDDASLLAHYHNSIAIQQMARGDIGSALERMNTVLRLDPQNATHWSNAGVLRLRLDDLQGARQAYEHGLMLDPDEPAILFNMMYLLRQQNEPVREAEFRRHLDAVQRKDPLHQFLLGLDLERSGNHVQAIAHYQLAIRYHRSEHRFHAALARAYLAIGDQKKASRALNRAKALSHGAVESLYSARLEQLRAGPEPF